MYFIVVRTSNLKLKHFNLKQLYFYFIIFRMAPATQKFTEKWAVAHTRLHKRMQWNAICLAGLSISEQKRNNTKELGSHSTKNIKNLLTLRTF